VVDLDATLGQQLLDVPVGEAEAQIPADRYDNDIGWEAEAGEGRPSARNGIRAARAHAGSLPARVRPSQMQQRRWVG
jgi:hypothetical protein